MRRRKACTKDSDGEDSFQSQRGATVFVFLHGLFERTDGCLFAGCGIPSHVVLSRMSNYDETSTAANMQKVPLH